MTIEIFFSDLIEQTQKDVLQAAGINDPKEANWDVLPLATVILGEGDEK